jgi:hypothetical protein
MIQKTCIAWRYWIRTCPIRPLAVVTVLVGAWSREKHRYPRRQLVRRVGSLSTGNPGKGRESVRIVGELGELGVRSHGGSSSSVSRSSGGKWGWQASASTSGWCSEHIGLGIGGCWAVWERRCGALLCAGRRHQPPGSLFVLEDGGTKEGMCAFNAVIFGMGHC